MAKKLKSPKTKSASKSLTSMSQLERAVQKQSAKVLGATTKRYRGFMKKAAKATNSKNRTKYLASALTALVVAGVVASKIKSRMNKTTGKR